jgi:hypothetical protein
MPQRITKSSLENVAKWINMETGNPLEHYSIVNGKTKANIGHFYISYQYGGAALMRICNESGGISMPLMNGHLKMRECFDMIHAFLKGIEYANKDKGN